MKNWMRGINFKLIKLLNDNLNMSSTLVELKENLIVEKVMLKNMT